MPHYATVNQTTIDAATFKPLPHRRRTQPMHTAEARHIVRQQRAHHRQRPTLESVTQQHDTNSRFYALPPARAGRILVVWFAARQSPQLTRSLRRQAIRAQIPVLDPPRKVTVRPIEKRIFPKEPSRHRLGKPRHNVREPKRRLLSNATGRSFTGSTPGKARQTLSAIDLLISRRFRTAHWAFASTVRSSVQGEVNDARQLERPGRLALRATAYDARAHTR
ncbi:hypothetical protein RP20_CCG015320 [Aedes albopictus]|nr:hypothetical protein RP20_CCG015320 [Aedes albopictus]